MNKTTHQAFGICCSAVVLAFTGTQANIFGTDVNMLVAQLAMPIGALLPDLDHHGSTITRNMGVAGKVVNNKLTRKVIKHRGFFHSLWMLGVFIFLAFQGIAVGTRQPLFLDIFFILLMAASFISVGKLKGKFKLLSYSVAGSTLAIVLMHHVFRQTYESICLTLSIGLSIGYISHLIADMFNTKGIPLFWPVPTKLKFPLFNISTGSTGETIFMIVSIILTACLLYYRFGGGVPW